MAERPSLGDLLTLGQNVTAGELLGDALVDAIIDYCSTFQSWYDEANLGAEDQDELARLEQIHSSVLSKAQMLQDEVSTGLRAVKTKGKGILAYTDNLPRKVSSVRAKKG